LPPFLSGKRFCPGRRGKRIREKRCNLKWYTR
jgi:hypothetical protein